MEHENDAVTKTVIILLIWLITGAAVGGCIGFHFGITYQKAQPVNIVVSWYNATENTASFDEYSLTDKGEISIYPQQGITEYNIQKSHVGDP